MVLLELFFFLLSFFVEQFENGMRQLTFDGSVGIEFEAST